MTNSWAHRSCISPSAGSVSDRRMEMERVVIFMKGRERDVFWVCQLHTVQSIPTVYTLIHTQKDINIPVNWI